MGQLNTDQNYPNVTLSFTDNQGRPATVDPTSPPVWASSDETVLAVTVSADGMTATVDSVAPGGPARVSATADADLGSGVTPLVGFSEDITVIQGPNMVASVMMINLGAPAEKPQNGG